MSDLEIDDALFGRPYVRGMRSVTIREGEDIETRLQFAPVIPPHDSPAMLEALAAMDRAGRESKAWREKRGIR